MKCWRFFFFFIFKVYSPQKSFRNSREVSRISEVFFTLTFLDFLPCHVHPVSLSVRPSVSPRLPLRKPCLYTPRLQRWVFPGNKHSPHWPFFFFFFLMIPFPSPLIAPTTCLLAVGPHSLLHIPHKYISSRRRKKSHLIWLSSVLKESA